MFTHWRAIEADFWRFYRVEALRVPWQRFVTFLAGLPGEDSVFMGLLYQDWKERDSWRDELSKKTGRNYRPDKKRVLYAGEQL